MRRSLPIVLAASALIFSACGSDEPSTSATTIDGSATTTPSASTVPADTVPVDPDNCVDAEAGFDGTDFPEGEIPAAVRPCESPTELTVNVLREGTGHEAAIGDTIIVDYSGIRSVDGTLFDDSYSRGTPFEFVLGTGRVIAGWDEGLVGAQAGSLIRLDIPTKLAYADTPRGDVIQPGDALTYMIEVLAHVRTHHRS